MIDLGRYAGRPTLLAVAAMNLVTGLGVAAILAPLSFGGDVDIFRRGAVGARARAVTPRTSCTRRWRACSSVPLTWIPFEAAAAVMLAIGLVVLVAGVALETRGHAAIDRDPRRSSRPLTFAPVVNELLLGQVTLLIAAALYPAVRRGTATRRGIALGIALALIPKPLLLPVLFWMLVRRRQALRRRRRRRPSACTLVGVVLMGPDTYRLWVDVLTTTGRSSRQGNLSRLTHRRRAITLALVIAARPPSPRCGRSSAASRPGSSPRSSRASCSRRTR